MFKEISNLLARGRSGPQPRELWFKGAARELMAALGRAGRNGVRPSYAVVLHIEEIWSLTPDMKAKSGARCSIGGPFAKEPQQHASRR